MTRLPDFEAWAVFAKVAETGSFAATATEFGISQSTVSKAVGRLEARLKTTLFHRTSRRISLTESGRLSLDRASRLLAEGAAIESEVSEQSVVPKGRVRIAAPMSFGVMHLAPALPEFMRKFPEVALEIQFDDELSDLVNDGYDVALRISSLADSSLLARRLCTVRILLVGSPEYFKKHGKPMHPRELASHTTLFYKHSRPGQAWRFRHEVHGEFSTGVKSAVTTNNAEALNPALIAGLGVALQPEFLVWKELRAGTLEAVMTDWVVDPIALHIVTPPGRTRPVRVQVLIDHLAQLFARAPWARGEDRIGEANQ